jgi:uncharacterized delta-60 repeat protein
MLATASVLALAPTAQGAGAGLPDPTFGSGGFTILDEPAESNEQLYDLVIQPDGKILAAGAKGASKGFILARFNPDGSSDLGFGPGGIKVEPDLEETGSPRGIADIEARPDGKILAMGLGRGTGGLNSFLFARYTPEGVIDPTWGKGGFRLVQLATFVIPGGLALAPDGKIVGVGDSDSTVPVVRLTEDGKNDASFNAAPIGVRELDVPGTTSEAADAVKVLGDGTILVGGSAGSLGAFLGELDVEGKPVAGFGSGGTTTFDLGTNPTPSGSVESLQVLPDGRILAAGGASSGPGGNRQLVVARFTADGKLDPTFAGGGIFRSDPTSGGDEATALVVQPDGKIVVAGLRGQMNMDELGDTYLLRLTADGQLDPGFGAGGETVASASPFADQANGLALQGDGRPVIAGFADGIGGHQLLVGRFTVDQPVTATETKKDETAPTGRCGGRKATRIGTSKADRIVGTKGADVIVGLKGNDRIKGRGGNDLICAGAGNDVVSGGGGQDRLLGGAGKDRILGGPGRDICIGGGGRDSAGASCERLKRVP